MKTTNDRAARRAFLALGLVMQTWVSNLLAQVLPPDKIYEVGQQFGLYRWHIQDPVRFDKDLRVTIQALGWNKDGTYLQEQDNISSVVYWYQTEPHVPFQKMY